MSETSSFTVIARLRCDFTSKFGVPRQSGLAGHVESRVVFEPEFRSREALRGIDGFSHLWLIWGFDRVTKKGWSPTVRPPRLGGNERMGVFATRSPFRPNPIGLSCVRLLRVEDDCSLTVAGADMTDGTPIFDIKPYLPYADCVPGALGGYTDALPSRLLRVEFPPHLLARVPQAKREGLLEVLSHDPRPSYQEDPDRVYGMAFGALDIRFRVDSGTLYVVDALTI